MKIAALVPYHTGFCAGQRFRIELWARHLAPRGFEVRYFPFAGPALTGILHRPGGTLRKAVGMLRCYLDQLRRVAAAGRPDVVFVYREAALLGPAWIERLARRWKAPLIYDIDEPLWVPYVSPSNGRLNLLKCVSKTNDLFRMSDRVLAVNHAIADYASRYARKVSIVPMAVDTERYRPAAAPPPASPLRIGWVGTRTTQKNLDLVAEPLARMRESHGSVLRVVADEPMTLPGVDVDFISWGYDLEVPRLQECQIGIVPVGNEVWNPWKFFFKLIQFMSLGLPVVATPVGSNLEIIEDGVNGFLAGTPDEWVDRLRTLAENPELRRRMGQAARETAAARFSLAGQIDFVESVFRGN
jgi:glycosyltransferase involved in cell wall biosynthesis